MKKIFTCEYEINKNNLKEIQICASFVNDTEIIRNFCFLFIVICLSYYNFIILGLIFSIIFTISIIFKLLAISKIVEKASDYLREDVNLVHIDGYENEIKLKNITEKATSSYKYSKVRYISQTKRFIVLHIAHIDRLFSLVICKESISDISIKEFKKFLLDKCTNLKSKKIIFSYLNYSINFISCLLLIIFTVYFAIMIQL